MDYNQIAVRMLADNAPQAELTRLARVAERHLRIMLGKECPYCGSGNTVDNGNTEAWCNDCDSGWAFADYKKIDPQEAAQGNIVPVYCR